MERHNDVRTDRTGGRQEAGTPVRRIHSWNSSKYKTINICFGNVFRLNRFYANMLKKNL